MSTPGLLIVDLQKDFRPNAELIQAIDRETYNYTTIVQTKFINKPDSLFRTRLDWHISGGDLMLTIPNALILEKTGYGLNLEHINKLKSLNCPTWHICGMETDACILACAFSLWDADLLPIIRPELCASNVLQNEGLRVAKRQFGLPCI